MLKKTLALSVVGLLAVGASSVASAQDLYVGGTVGQSKWNNDCKAVSKCDTNTTAFKVIGGYNFNKNFAFETTLFSLGKANGSAPFANTIASADVKAGGIDFAGVGKVNFTDELSGFAKLGFGRVTSTINASVANVGSGSQDTTSTQPVAALGLTYKIGKDWALRGEFESRRLKLATEKETVNTFSIGAQYSF